MNAQLQSVARIVPRSPALPKGTCRDQHATIIQWRHADASPASTIAAPVEGLEPQSVSNTALNVGLVLIVAGTVGIAVARMGGLL